MDIIDKDPFNAASFDLEFDLVAILDHTDFSTQEVSAMATELEKQEKIKTFIKKNC